MLLRLQCFDSVGWAAGRASACKNSVVRYCLEQGGNPAEEQQTEAECNKHVEG